MGLVELLCSMGVPRPSAEHVAVATENSANATRLALARALVPECAVVPREDAADHIEAIDMWLGDNADETPASVWGSINILGAMLAAGQATP